MASNIKGITIDFRGETTKLDKALRDIRDNTKALDRELKGVDNALKFNPTNVDLWRQKQTLLTQKVDETKSKLDVLKQAQAKMDTEGVDKNTAEYRDLERQIIVTENQVKNFEGELRKIGNAKLTALSEEFKGIGSKLEGIGKGLSTHVTAPIVGVGAASIKAFGEVKDGLNIVANKTGATGEDLKAMQDISRDLAKTLPTTFEDAGIAVGELNTRFGVTGKELDSLSEQYIKFAKVNGVDLNTSIDETQKALSAFGLSAAEAPRLLDTLTKAGQLTGASVDNLTSGLIQNATAFQELGLGLDQSVLLMAQLEKSGANSETVMNGLRKALKNAAADGKPLDQALAELQDTIKNGSGSMDGLTAAYDLFGKSGDQIYGAVKNGTIDFKNLAVAAGSTGGTLDAVFNETLTPAEKFQTTMNSVKDAGYQIGSSIMTVLEPAMNKLATKMQEVSDWWGKLSPEAQDAIVKIALIAGTVGPLLILLGKLATGVGAIIKLVGIIGPAISGLALGPMAIVAAAIAAVIAIGVLLYKNWDKIKATAQAVGAKIKEVWEGIKASVGNAAQAVKDKVSAAWDSVKTKTSAAWDWIKEKITAPFRSAKETIASVADGIRDKIDGVWDKIKEKTGNAWTSIRDKILAPFNWAKDKISEIVEKIKGWFPIDIGDLFGGIKLPHFNIEWSSIGFGDYTIDYPSGFDIDWYKKGGIFSSPSVIGVGEAGSEAVVPLDKFWDKLDNLAANQTAPVINIYARDGQSAREIAKEVEKILVQEQKQKASAYGTI